MEKIVQYCQAYFFKAGELSHNLARILRGSDHKKVKSADQRMGATDDQRMGATDMHASLSKFLQLRPNIFVYQKLGWGVASAYVTILGKLYFFFKRKEKCKIEGAVTTLFEGHKSKSEIESIKRNVFRGIQSHYYEKLFNAFSSADALKDFLRLHIKSEGLMAVEQGLSRGKGVLLVTGHLGGVEFIPGYLASNNYPVTILVRFSSNHLRNISTRKADEFAAKIIDAENSPNIIKAVYDSLKENRIVVTQCDEIDEWRPSRYQRVLFLGKEINLDKTIDTIIKRVVASIVFGIMHRNDNQEYRFVVNSLEDMAKRLKGSENMSVGALVLKFLEQNIYRYPEEWYQWKNYPGITISPSPRTRVEITKSPSLVKPAFSRIS
jgi:KDO2-lipid IV(A) lauroyltransferase